MNKLEQLKINLAVYQEGLEEARNSKERKHYCELCIETYNEIQEIEL